MLKYTTVRGTHAYMYILDGNSVQKPRSSMRYVLMWLLTIPDGHVEVPILATPLLA
jgi:hypothetical protein